MTFASKFAAGQQFAKGLIDTYQSSKQQQEFEDIQKATREDSQGYSEANLDSLRQFAQDKNEDGTARYTMEPGTDGGYNVRANTAYQGDDGIPVPQGTAFGIQPQRMSTFLGQRYNANELSPERMEGLRNRAMAGVISKTDPIRGMALQQQITAGERDAQRFKNEQTTFGNAQTTFGNEQAEFGLRKKRGERQDVHEEQVAADEKTDREIGVENGKYLASLAQNKDGTPRALTMEDHTGALQHRATLQLKAGRVDAANATMKEFAQQSLTTIALQASTRGEAINVAAGHLAAGNWQGVADFYNKYVPDGGQSTGITQDKDGSITMNRKSLDGRPMAPTVFKSREEMLNGLMSFKDPLALYSFSRNQFNDNLHERTTKATEKQASAAVTSAGAHVISAQSTSDYNKARTTALEAGAKNEVAIQDLNTRFDALTPPQQAGLEGDGIRKQLQMLNTKPGAGLAGVGGGNKGGSAAIKYQIDNVWADIEKKRIGDGNVKDLPADKDAFYGSRGFAPASAVNQLMNPRKPDGTKQTAADLEDFNRLFSHTPIDASKVPWLKEVPKAAPGSKAAGTTQPQGLDTTRANQPPLDFFKERQKQVAAGTEKLNADPRVPKLLAKKDDAIRRGKTVEANGYLAEIGAIKKSYGL